MSGGLQVGEKEEKEEMRDRGYRKGLALIAVIC